MIYDALIYRRTSSFPILAYENPPAWLLAPPKQSPTQLASVRCDITFTKRYQTVAMQSSEAQHMPNRECNRNTKREHFRWTFETRDGIKLRPSLKTTHQQLVLQSEGKELQPNHHVTTLKLNFVSNFAGKLHWIRFRAFGTYFSLLSFWTRRSYVNWPISFIFHFQSLCRYRYRQLILQIERLISWVIRFLSTMVNKRKGVVNVRKVSLKAFVLSRMEVNRLLKDYFS